VYSVSIKTRDSCGFRLVEDSVARAKECVRVTDAVVAVPEPSGRTFIGRKSLSNRAHPHHNFRLYRHSPTVYNLARSCSDRKTNLTMKIAVLTSGGDSAGMNAVVRAVVKAGILKYVLLPPFFFRGVLALKKHTH
jgi:hypothetical protein